MKFIFFLSIIFNILISTLVNSNEIYVVTKVNNKIITNQDISNEYRYLIALSPSLQDIDKKKVMKLAKNSLIKEIIKEDEIIKYFDLSVENRMMNKIVSNFYKQMGMSNENEFIKYLSEYNLDFKDIKKKISIETAWNDLIYKKFANKIELDEDQIKKNIQKNILEKKLQDMYFISEILFSADDYNELQKKYEIISKSISEIGFENTANIHSISDSAKFGGKIGWVYESQLNDILKKEVTTLEVNTYTKPITIPSGFLIIKLDNKKKEEVIINFNEELKKQISNERNLQLQQFSKIYFKKIKKNSTISEK